jgi:hypothetical protein
MKKYLKTGSDQKINLFVLEIQFHSSQKKND